MSLADISLELSNVAKPQTSATHATALPLLVNNIFPRCFLASSLPFLIPGSHCPPLNAERYILIMQRTEQ